MRDCEIIKYLRLITDVIIFALPLIFNWWFATNAVGFIKMADMLWENTLQIQLMLLIFFCHAVAFKHCRHEVQYEDNKKQSESKLLS